MKRRMPLRVDAVCGASFYSRGGRGLHYCNVVVYYISALRWARVRNLAPGAAWLLRSVVIRHANLVTAGIGLCHRRICMFLEAACATLARRLERASGSEPLHCSPRSAWAVRRCACPLARRAAQPSPRLLERGAPRGTGWSGGGSGRCCVLRRRRRSLRRP